MYRTDLAIERMEMAGDEGVKTCDSGGVSIEKNNYGDDVTSTLISIIDNNGERLLGKPKGKYITIETKSVLEENEDAKCNVIDAVAAENFFGLILVDVHLSLLLQDIGVVFYLFVHGRQPVAAAGAEVFFQSQFSKNIADGNGFNHLCRFI